MIKAGVITVFLLLSGTLQAQQEEEAPVVDTIIQEGTITVEPREEDGTIYDNVQQEKQYFLPRSIADSVHLHHIADSTVASMKRQEEFWYADAAVKQKEKKQKQAGRKPARIQDEDDDNSSSGGGIFQFFLWLLIIVGFIGFLVIYLSNSNVRVFRRSRTIATEDEGDISTDDIFAIPYQKELDKAIAAGNYRLAVRLLYLRLLRVLADKNMIHYSPERTNFDYLLQMQPTRWYTSFFRLTRHYEYAWYGQFEIDRDKFGIIQTDFVNLEQQLR